MTLTAKRSVSDGNVIGVPRVERREAQPTDAEPVDAGTTDESNILQLRASRREPDVSVLHPRKTVSSGRK